MTTHVRTPAGTRQALLDAAEALLSTGGPDAVTLREVGARAGVSRSAPYRHFTGKEHLLMAVATQAWDQLGAALQELADDTSDPPDHLLHQALITLADVARTRPHLYRLMFAAPAADPAEVIRAAGHAQEVFVSIVIMAVGPRDASKRAGLLFAAAHGAADLELSGHLPPGKWHASADDLTQLLISLLTPRLPHQDSRGTGPERGLMAGG